MALTLLLGGLGLLGYYALLSLTSWDAALPAPEPPEWLLAAAAACAALWAPVVLRWLSTDCARDWVQGGLIRITRDEPGLLEWEDWAVAVTRHGRLDFEASTVVVVRRALYGLIPAGRFDRPLGDFYRVEVDREEITYHQPWMWVGHGSLSGRGGFDAKAAKRVAMHSSVGTCRFTLSLVDRRARRLPLLDFIAADGRGSPIIARMRERVEEHVGVPGGGGPGSFVGPRPPPRG